jgi:hypothetical protein
LKKKRDFVILQYSDIFPEDNFAVICCSSVERADVKPTKGIYRAEMFSGYLMRQNNYTVSLTFIFHGDGKVETHTVLNRTKGM